MRTPAFVQVFSLFAFLTVPSLSQPLAAQTRGLDVVARSLVGNNSFDVGKQYAVIIGINRYAQ
ncbi:MAG: hypothetical protein WCT14_19385, partial [Treponemataceae bacterium]